MPYSKSIKKWKKRLITWIKESDDADDSKLKIIRQFKKYKRILHDYERVKILIEKAKLHLITDIEKQEFTDRLRKLSKYRASEINEIMGLYKILSPMRNPDINPKQDIIKAKKKLTFYQRATLPKHVVKFHRKNLNQPQNPIKSNNKIWF